MVILPGFVNAHTHLELTNLRGRVPLRGSFVRWVEDLVALRWLNQPEADQIGAIRQGAGLSLAGGVTAAVPTARRRRTRTERRVSARCSPA